MGDAIDIFILFPKGRVSPVQQRQMTTVQSSNVHCIAIDGTFDDCQDLVKALFADEAFRTEVNLSAVNSIKWARVMAQTAYYAFARLQLGAPDRPVTLSLGDGAVMYSSSAFWSMARYGLPILTVVFNNMQYQTVRTNFAAWGGSMGAQNKYPETFLGDPEIDFVMLAKAQGIEGMRVDEPGDLEAALKRGSDAQAAGEPYLLDVRITNVGAGADQSWYMPHKVGAA